MCVFLKIHVLKFSFERCFWVINMLIGSLVELHVGLHSCLCFSHLEKLFLKAGSTPPRYLLDSWLSVELPKVFSYRNLAYTSIPGGSIEIGSVCSTASRYLVDRLSFCSKKLVCWSSIPPRHLNYQRAFPRHLHDRSLDTSRYQHLSRFTGFPI